MIRDPISLRSVAELWSRDYGGIPTNDDIYRDLLKSFWLGEFEPADGTMLVFTDEGWSEEGEPDLFQLYRVDGELEPVASINWVGNPVSRGGLFHTLILAEVSIPVIQEDRKNLLNFSWMKARGNSENVFTLLSTVPPDRWPNRAHRYLRTIAISHRNFIGWCEKHGHEPPAVLVPADISAADNAEHGAGEEPDDRIEVSSTVTDEPDLMVNSADSDFDWELQTWAEKIWTGKEENRYLSKSLVADIISKSPERPLLNTGGLMSADRIVRLIRTPPGYGSKAK
jgi:hypothetical protein